MSIPEHVIDSPPQADAVGHGAVPVGIPEDQQTVPLALRNQLESIIGDLRLAYARLGQLPPEAIEADTFAGLTRQYAQLMDIAGQLSVRMNELGPMIGEDLGLAKEINRLQGDVEMYIGAVESNIASMMAMELQQQQYEPNNGNRQQWEVAIEQAVIDPMIPGNGSPAGRNANGDAYGNGNGAALAPADNKAWLRWGLVIGGLLVVAGGTYYYYRQQRITPAF